MMHEANAERLSRIALAIDTVHCWPIKPYVFALHDALHHSFTRTGIPCLNRLSSCATYLNFSRLDHPHQESDELLVEFNLRHNGRIVREWRQQRFTTMDTLVASVTADVTTELLKLLAVPEPTAIAANQAARIGEVDRILAHLAGLHAESLRLT